MHSLLLHVNLLHREWHGLGDWPPSPFRLFQAMVAGAFGGRWAGEDQNAKEQRLQAFQWLERQQPPDIVAPPRSQCGQITSYVPNNDLDSVGGDPRRVEEIRAEKAISSVRLEDSRTFLYAWHFETGEAEANLLCDLADRLHTFGRGVDPAWVRAEVIDRDAAESCLVAHGAVARPTGPTGANLLPCPADGSLQSLLDRHWAQAHRLRYDRTLKKTFFRQPTKAHYRQVGYDTPPSRFFFELRDPDNLGRFVPVPQTKALLLTEAVRDQAAQRLSRAAEKYASLADRFVIGRGAGSADRDRRVRIVPLPTIGHPHASPSIRRVAVEVPPQCPLSAHDMKWAFTGLTLPVQFGSETLSASPALLLPAESHDMLRHYGWGAECSRWRSVTPVAMPISLARVRNGVDRSLSEAHCVGAFVNALRHAGVTTPVAGVRLQREPFHAKGAAADAFESPRFTGRLRHVEVVFRSPVRGPLILGDGRFVGLGVMQCVLEPPPGLHVFAVHQSSAPAASRSTAIVRALRRAIMARAQALYDRKQLPVIFHGHEEDGSPARPGNHRHLFFAAFSSEGSDRIDRLAVIAPALCDRSISDRRHWDDLARAVNGLRILRCGRDGVLTLTPLSSDSDPAFFWQRVRMDFGDSL